MNTFILDFGLTMFFNFGLQTLEDAAITCWRDRRMEVGTNWSEV
jgi:hypothetical protein